MRDKSLMGKTIFGLVLGAAMLFAFAASTSAQTSYSKSAELPALRVSYSELQAILDKAAALVVSANSKSAFEISREQIEIRAGEIRMRISGHTLIEPKIRLPKSADRFTYVIDMRDRAPVTTLEMDFSGSTRSLAVHGSSAEQVDAVFAVLRDELVTMSSSVGGSVLVSFLRFILISVFASIAIVLFLWWLERRRRQALVMSLVALSLVVLLAVLPIHIVLAGFLAVDGDPSFLVRYGPEKSFLGLILGLAAFPFSYWLSAPSSKFQYEVAELAPGEKLQKVIDAPRKTSPGTNTLLLVTNPYEIVDRVASAPLLQQADVAKQYAGIVVDWPGTLISARKSMGDEDKVDLLIQSIARESDRSRRPGISFDVNPAHYPGIGLLEQGDHIRVAGRISDIRYEIIELEEVKILEYGKQKAKG
jgi:hypothetical protein